LKVNKVNLFVSSVLFVFWYHSPNILDTPHICNISRLRVKATISFTSVRPRETTRPPLGGFSLNLIYEDNSKIRGENSNLIKIGHE
jgi:hypothetical protein